MSTRQIYSPQFLASYRRSRSKLPIHVWKNVIGKNLTRFKNNPAAIYNDVTLRIKMAGRENTPGGTIQVKVNPIDSNWYESLCKDVAGMMQQRGSIDLVDARGRKIDGMKHNDLLGIGELNVVQSRRADPVRLRESSALGLNIPAHLATNKRNKLNNWYENDIRDSVCEAISDHLSKKSMAELSAVTLPNSSLDAIIRSTIEQRTRQPMQEFLDHHGMDVKSRSADPRLTVQAISRSILHALRSGLRANEKRIGKFYAQQESEKHGAESLWSTSLAPDTEDYGNTYDMFYDIAEDAMYNSALQRKIIRHVNRGLEQPEEYQPVACHNSMKKKKKKKKEYVETKYADRDEDDADHPLHAFYTDIYWPLYDKMPGKYLKKTQEKYPGSNRETFKYYHMFSGEPTRPGKKAVVSVSEEIPDLIPIEKEIPDLIPIEKEIPDLIPLEQEIPGLIPISCVDHLRDISGGLVDLDAEIAAEEENFDDELFSAPTLADFIKN